MRAHPQVYYRRVEANRPLPFPDKAFDIACANAVLEHVGSAAAQAAFIAELWRVAGHVFITVPHRFFPIEHHTALPLVHWTDTSFRWACRLAGKDDWCRPDTLILMSRRRLAALCPPGAQVRIGYSGLRLGPFSSNLYLAIGV
jgi:SAM-dependent methyltransferase